MSLAAFGREGAEVLLSLLNAYFSEMIAIISKSGGNLLEFTGDALLVQFPTDERRQDTLQAVRAGLRMQHAMARFARIETAPGTFSFGMRVGIHIGRYLTADVGTPHRMEHVLLGGAVQRAKDAEGAGQVGRVCLTQAACQRVGDAFRCEPGVPGHWLVVDDLSEGQLGEYDIAPPTWCYSTAASRGWWMPLRMPWPGWNPWPAICPGRSSPCWWRAPRSGGSPPIFPDRRSSS